MIFALPLSCASLSETHLLADTSPSEIVKSYAFVTPPSFMMPPSVMVRPLVPHVLLKPHLHLRWLDPFLMLSDWPPTASVATAASW